MSEHLDNAEVQISQLIEENTKLFRIQSENEKLKSDYQTKVSRLSGLEL